jgi:hypothetical protein
VKAIPQQSTQLANYTPVIEETREFEASMAARGEFVYSVRIVKGRVGWREGCVYVRYWYGQAAIHVSGKLSLSRASCPFHEHLTRLNLTWVL